MMARWASKSGLDLVQNCDLPPPVKVFAGPDKALLSPMNRVFLEEDGKHEILGVENEKVELLKALRLSQTRAREAEKRADVLAKERDCLCKAFMDDSSRLFAYRQWVKLLEVQLLRLQTQQQEKEKQFCEGEEDGEDGGVGGMTWFVAWALCLGIAGVGFAFGCKYIF